jgi:hypothetical protein
MGLLTTRHCLLWMRCVSPQFQSMLKDIQAHFQSFGLQVISITDPELYWVRWQLCYINEPDRIIHFFERLKDVFPWWKKVYRQHLAKEAVMQFLWDEYESGHVAKCQYIDQWLNGTEHGYQPDGDVVAMRLHIKRLLDPDLRPPAPFRWKEKVLRLDQPPSETLRRPTREEFFSHMVEFRRSPLNRALPNATSEHVKQRRL